MITISLTRCFFVEMKWNKSCCCRQPAGFFLALSLNRCVFGLASYATKLLLVGGVIIGFTPVSMNWNLGRVDIHTHT